MRCGPEKKLEQQQKNKSPAGNGTDWGDSLSRHLTFLKVIISQIHIIWTQISSPKPLKKNANSKCVLLLMVPENKEKTEMGIHLCIIIPTACQWGLLRKHYDSRQKVWSGPGIIFRLHYQRSLWHLRGITMVSLLYFGLNQQRIPALYSLLSYFECFL